MRYLIAFINISLFVTLKIFSSLTKDCILKIKAQKPSKNKGFK